MAGIAIQEELPVPALLRGCPGWRRRRRPPIGNAAHDGALAARQARGLASARAHHGALLAATAALVPRPASPLRQVALRHLRSGAGYADAHSTGFGSHRSARGGRVRGVRSPVRAQWDPGSDPASVDSTSIRARTRGLDATGSVTFGKRDWCRSARPLRPRHGRSRSGRSPLGSPPRRTRVGIRGDRGVDGPAEPRCRADGLPARACTTHGCDGP